MFLEATTKSIRRRVAIVGSMLIISPMIVVSLAGWAVLQRVERVAAAAEIPAPSIQIDLAQMAQNLVDLCRKYQQAAVEALKNGQRILKEKGPIRLDGANMSTWHTKNELTGEEKSFEIPLMSAGDVNFAPVADFDQPAPVVDDITKSDGTLATVFQRVNDRGDMLRVASSFKSAQGTRAIATFIPADAREGESAKILQDVLNGKTYVGTEVQGNVTYLTAYQPLTNGWGKVVGMLNTILPEEQIKTQVEHLAATGTKTADKPQLFILQASGPSLEGQDIRSRATQLTVGQIGKYKFQKTLRAGGIPRTITAQFAYLPELDWVVGFTQPESDSQAGMPLAQFLVWAMWSLFGVGVAATGLAVRIWLKFSDDLAPKLNDLLDHLRKDTKQLTAAAVELSHEAEHVAQPVVSPLKVLSDAPNALQHLDASNAWSGELLDAIDQITFATNHLMVAAASDGSESVADSADEIRSLVQRCRNAARKARKAVQQSRTQLEKESAAPPDQSTLVLRRQTENLLRLAAGIDHSVEVVAAEVTVTETEDVG